MFKNNLLKTSLAVGALFLGFSFFYYFVIFLPSKDKLIGADVKAQRIQEQIEKCAALGSKYYTQDLKNNIGSIILNPEYKYSEKLNTCIYMTGYIDGKITTKTILDLYTNQIIANYIKIPGVPLPDDIEQLNKFKAKSIELFGNTY